METTTQQHAEYMDSMRFLAQADHNNAVLNGIIAGQRKQLEAQSKTLAMQARMMVTQAQQITRQHEELGLLKKMVRDLVLQVK